MINLEDFFFYYDRNNPQHRLAIQVLQEKMNPDHLMDSSEWVKIYRTPVDGPAPPPGKSIAASESNRESHYTGVIDWDNPRCYVSEYFTVGEVTQNDRRRRPKDDRIIHNILTLAKYLDQVRYQWGSPIGVSSWYRPEPINSALGGSRFSQHLTATAADLYPLNRKYAEFEDWLDRGLWKDRALGYGMASGKGFTHLDLRKGRIRWRY